MTLSKIIFLLVQVSIFFTDAAEVATSGSGKAIYTSSRNPIASYFKEHKNKLRPYFTRPASDSNSDQLYGQGLSIHDDTSAQVEPSTLYSHSSYYDASGSPEKDTSPDDPHGSNAFMDLYDSSSNPEYQASNVMYSVMDPLSNGYASPGGAPPSSGGVNPGYYADPHLGGYSQPSYHPPGLPPPSTPSAGNAGYYGTGDTAHAHPPPPMGYENSIYSNPPAAAAHDNTLYHAPSGSPAPPPTHHHGNHAPTSNNHNTHNNHDKNNEGSDNSDLFPIPGEAGYGASEDEEAGADNGYAYDYGTTVTEDDETLMELPLFGGGGGGSTPAAAPAPTPAPAAADPSTTDNPLNFLNLVGTDFQPGRLVNIFFGLFIMLFMIIFHGYALWILGIAYLPGTRSLNQWELDKDKVGSICNLVLDALEYWENKID